ncbi:hypothetical protein J3E73DRAFT_366406 [Bipolaris maydis]|nr:hypothetical protein J3E73DRAFT_366406 [Bipolaris maydis]
MQFTTINLLLCAALTVSAAPGPDLLSKRTCGTLTGTELKVCQDACKVTCDAIKSVVAKELCKDACDLPPLARREALTISATPSPDLLSKRTCGTLTGTELTVCQDACKVTCDAVTGLIAKKLCKSACDAPPLARREAEAIEERSVGKEVCDAACDVTCNSTVLALDQLECVKVCTLWDIGCRSGNGNVNLGLNYLDQNTFLSNIAFQYYPLDLETWSNPFVVSWWPLALNDPALFHVSLQTASLDLDLKAQNGVENSELLMADSIALVRRRVEDQSLACRDETIDSVVTLAAIEFGKGNTTVSSMHIEGVKKMVQIRGGIHALKLTSPLTARMVAWVSIVLMQEPQFDVQNDETCGDAIAPIQEWIQLGLSPRAVRQLYLACVTSVADYGCQIFWREQQTTLNQRQKLQNQACRKILGSFRTSPAIPSEVEAALYPPRIRLNNALRQYAFRARKLAPSHPLNIAINSNQGKQLERITRSISTALSEDSEKIQHYASMPWSATTPYRINISKKSKESEAEHHKELLEDEHLLSIYSDASATSKGKGVGVGVALYKGASLIAQEKANIGYNQLVYNGELEGITLGLEKAVDLADDYLEVRIYADNQAAILRLKTASDYPGQEWQLRCTIAAEKLQEKGILPTIQWVPGHQGVIGNERADALAKEATKLDPSSSRTSLAVIGTRIKQLGEREWLSYLGQYGRKAITLNPTTYAARYKWKTRKQIATPPTSREASSAFYQLKLGHCYLRDFLFKRGKVDSKACPCNYRATQDPAHILLSCTLYKEARKKMQETTKDPLSLAFLLDTTIGVQATITFIKETRAATQAWYKGNLDN